MFIFTQIISFLHDNAHPRIVQKIPRVPENVTDQVSFFFFWYLASNSIHVLVWKLTLIFSLQIRLWENDRNRVEMTHSHLYEDFPSRVNISSSPLSNNWCCIPSWFLNSLNQPNIHIQDVFEAACDYARELGGLLWRDSKKMFFIVNGDAHQDMRDFLRRQK